MVFSSLTFLLFFLPMGKLRLRGFLLPITLLLYFLSKNSTYRNTVLLIVSLLFYAWGEPKWIFVMLLTVSVNYVCGLLMAKTTKKPLRTLYMLLGVSLSVGFLFYFKYCGFVLDTWTNITGFSHTFEAPVLPIGISFYTFQVLTYTIDVYRGKTTYQKSFFNLLLYISFFPQLIAGPIVNYKDIEAQLGKRTITTNQFYEGFLRFLIGLNKKILIANTCGELTEKLIAAGEFSVAGAWIFALAYTLQIYFDFSGYSDMAIGIGKMFGFHFLENFNYPYRSKSITEFWRNWHISLGSFFRDYVYIPLGGNRLGMPRQILNIFIVWMLTGIWHGASWNFVVWGVYYGVLLILEKLFFLKIKEKLPAILNIVTTLFLVIIGWILFYYIDLGDGLNHLKIMFGFSGQSLSNPASVYYGKHYAAFLAAGVFASFPWKNLLSKWFSKENKSISAIAFYGKPVAVTLLFFVALSLLVGQSYNPFLYFRF